MHDRTHDGKSFRTLISIDKDTRECLGWRVQRKISYQDVLETLTELFFEQGVPATWDQVTDFDHRQESARVARQIGDQTAIDRTGLCGEWIYRVIQREDEGRVAISRDLSCSEAGKDFD
jgi:hypothetical protein